MLYSILMVVQVVLAVGIIALVLLQHGKGADAGAAFGSGASSTVFGSRGSASFLSRSTAVMAALFFLNSMALAYMASNRPVVSSVVETVEVEAVEDAVGEPQVPSAQPEQPDLPPQDVPR
jgi:preprotein translocase subunit SecG